MVSYFSLCGKVIVAYIIDLVIGDPYWLPHPVIVIGKVIQWLEQALRRLAKSALGLRLAGIVLVFFVVGSSYVATLLLLKLFYFINPWVALGGEIWLISTTLATRGLGQAANEVLIPLKQGDLAIARLKVGKIVGRDTQNMDEENVTRATVETVAENIVDGVISPLFYACFGGAPLAMAYRAVNTLDSMVGYRNEKYYAFGWAAARLDDLANYIPARITGIMLVFAAWFSGYRAKEAWRIMCRDFRRHSSLNSGIPEAAVAGALGVQLGGLSYYQGKPFNAGYLGDVIEPINFKHIKQAVNLLYLTTGLDVVLITIIYLIYLARYFVMP